MINNVPGLHIACFLSPHASRRQFVCARFYICTCKPAVENVVVNLIPCCPLKSTPSFFSVFPFLFRFFLPAWHCLFFMLACFRFRFVCMTSLVLHAPDFFTYFLYTVNNRILFILTILSRFPDYVYIQTTPSLVVHASMLFFRCFYISCM